MRHGAVSYFDPAGRPVAPEQVDLNALGRMQAQAAGEAFAAEGVRFDRVIASGLPRTVQTAALVLQHCGQSDLTMDVWPEWQEIRGGRLAGIAPEALAASFLGLERGVLAESTRFLDGESVGELLDRVLPGIQRLRADPHWDCALLVLHGVVNGAILSHALSGGQRQMFGAMVQSPACINVLDMGPDPDDWLLRVCNYAPTGALHVEDRNTTMEALYNQYLQFRRQNGSTQ